MSTDPVPVAVVGAGNMGINHVRVYDELPESNLVEVVEPDPEQAAAVRKEYDVAVLDAVSDIERARAASVAVPNRYHRSTALDLIEHGLDILVEKPLAVNFEDAEAIVEAAKEQGVILQVGHIERFNPAVQALESILSDQKVIELEAHRLGPFNEHLTGESVVFDLMIHDLDVIRSLLGTQVTSLNAIGTQTKSEGLDHAVAYLTFEGGVLGTMKSSHVTHSKIRTLTATTKDAYIELDYQRQDITINRRGSEETTLLRGKPGYRTETIQETPFVQTREPLKNELESFLEAVKSRTTPLVDGNEGLEAVRLALDVMNTINVT